MRTTLLGTGSPLPDASRAGPSTLVQAGGATFLVDCGRGVLMRAAAIGVGAGGITALLVTHLHSDHITDLTDVITTRWVTSFGPDPLRIIGPPRTQQVVDGILASLAPDIEYRLAHHEDLSWAPAVEVAEVTEGVVWDDGTVRVVAGATDHRPAQPSVGYRIEHDGRAVVLAGDTVPCPSLDALCAGADVLVHTVVRDDILMALPMQRLKDVCDYHSSVTQAAETAERAGVGTLVLTHQVPAVGPGDEETWRSLAASAFSGRIEVGVDLLAVGS